MKFFFFLHEPQSLNLATIIHGLLRSPSSQPVLLMWHMFDRFLLPPNLVSLGIVHATAELSAEPMRIYCGAMPQFTRCRDLHTSRWFFN
jgi:hypothetical protein